MRTRLFPALAISGYSHGLAHALEPANEHEPPQAHTHTHEHGLALTRTELHACNRTHLHSRTHLYTRTDLHTRTNLHTRTDLHTRSSDAATSACESS